MTDKVSQNKDDVIVIKKYANRRLYNTRTSSYITLDHLAKMTRDGDDFKVLDAKTGADITHSILTQIIMDEEASGTNQMLPLSFLRDLIGMYGNSVQGMFPSYLEESMKAFRQNQDQLAKAVQTGLAATPFGQIAQRNIEMLTNAVSAFTPGTKAADKPAASDDKGELDALRQQMDAMQKKLDALSSDK